MTSSEEKKVSSSSSSTNTSTKKSDIPTDRVVASPLAKNVARDSNVDLSQIQGSGPGGRILKQDVDSFVQSQVTKSSTVSETKTPSQTEQSRPA